MSDTSSKKKPAAASRTFIVFTTDQRSFNLEAPSLRTAVRNCGVKEEEILGVFDEICLPKFTAADLPFFAVLMHNPRYVAPNGPES